VGRGWVLDRLGFAAVAQRLRDDVAGKLGLPPRVVEAVAVTGLVGVTAAAAASVLAVALPTVLLATTALPGLFFLLFVVLSMGALVSTFVPVLVRPQRHPASSSASPNEL
jgi:hypothetical protein